MLGLIVPDIANPFFPPIIKAVQSRAEVRGKTVLIVDVDERPDDEVRRARQISSKVDGVIIVSPRASDAQLAQIRPIVPVVFVNRPVLGAASVVIDNATGIDEAIEHLVALGHRAICYLNGPRGSWSNQRRKEAVTSACKRCGVKLIELGPFEPQIQAGVRAADLVYAADASAVVAYDDLIALGLMSRLTERGIKVGREISVVGFDDSPLSSLAHPALSSIRVPGSEAGRVAVDLLLDVIETPSGDHSTPVLLETHLVARASTDIWIPRR